MMPMTQTAPYYGGNTPYLGQRPLRPATDYPRGAGHFVPAFIGDVPAPGFLGATADDPSGNLSALAYSAASVAGAAIGGGLVGYVASKKGQGAITGAFFTTGVAAISDAVTLGTQSKTGMAAAVGVFGLGALAWSIYRFRHAK